MRVDPNSVTLNPSTILRWLVAVAVVLVVSGTVLNAAIFAFPHPNICRALYFLNLDGEQTFPAYFSSAILLMAALLLVVIFRLECEHSGRRSKWGILAFGFLLMSLDEACSIHERFCEPMRRLLGERELGFLTFAWVVPAMFLVAGLALYFASFLRQLPAKSRCRFLAAAAAFVGGAVGVEMLGGRQWEAYGPHNIGYVLLVALEEGLEMTGAILFVHALFAHIAENFNGARLCLVAPPYGAVQQAPTLTVRDPNPSPLVLGSFGALESSIASRDA